MLIGKSSPVSVSQNIASTSREEIRRLNNQIISKNEQNRKLKKDIQGFHAVISNNDRRMNNLTSDLGKQKRTVGKYSMQVETLKNELQAWSFGNFPTERLLSILSFLSYYYIWP